MVRYGAHKIKFSARKVEWGLTEEVASETLAVREG